MTSCNFENILYFIVLYCALILLLHPRVYFQKKIDALFRKKIEFQVFVLVTFHWICVQYYASIIKFFSAYPEHFPLKYDLLYTRIPYILPLPCKGVLMHLLISTLYVNTNIYNSHNTFAHLYCLLHPSIVLYIIPYFMKNSHTSSE